MTLTSIEALHFAMSALSSERQNSKKSDGFLEARVAGMRLLVSQERDQLEELIRKSDNLILEIDLLKKTTTLQAARVRQTREEVAQQKLQYNCLQKTVHSIIHETTEYRMHCGEMKERVNELKASLLIILQKDVSTLHHTLAKELSLLSTLGAKSA